MKSLRNRLLHSLTLSLLAVPSAHAANATWTGLSNSNWAANANWTAAYPGAAETATFNGAGNGNTNISFGPIVSGIPLTVGTIVFDSTNVAAYSLGTGGVGAETFKLSAADDAGAITVNSTASNNQLFNANVILGASSTTATYNFTNNSATKHLLTFAGSVSSGTGTPNNQIKTLALDGSANGLISGIISGDGSGSGQNKTATVAITKTGAGVWTLSGTNTYAGGTTVTTGTLLANNATSATGTGSVSVGVNGILGGSGTIAPTGTNNFNVSGVLAPGGTVGGTGNLTINLGGTTGVAIMNNGASFQYDLGVAGADINNIGISDLLTLAGTTTTDTLSFSGNSINFGGTGATGYYKLFDSVRGAANTWLGLTVDGSGLITGGLTASNLASGLTGNLIMGGNSLGGQTGDIYLQVVPEPSTALLAGLGTLFLLRRRRKA